MSERYPGGFITRLDQTPNPALGGGASGIWTLDQVLQYKQAGVWPPTIDPNFENVTLLLHGNGTNGAQNNTFIDGSTNNYTITRNGNSTQGTFSPYGSNWSNYFDGTGDYLSIADNAALEFGSGNFTIECFIFADGSQVGDARIFHKAYTSTTGYTFIFQSATQLRFVAGTASVNIDITTTADFVSNQWNHVAVTRNGTNLNIWINGVSRASGTSSSTIGDNSGATTIGGDGSTNCKGYISNARIVKGTAVYTAAFTPPTAPLTAITNTSLLTCQSNQFIDNSTNAFNITRNGDVSVQRFSPFSPSAAYSTSTIGGSGYFAAGTDYLESSSNTTAITGDFTVEMWFYMTASTASDFVLLFNNGSYIQFANTPYTLYAGFAGFTNFSLGTMNKNSWIHLAITRSGSTNRVFLNGNLKGTQTASGSIFGGLMRVAQYSNTSRVFGGYISDFRVLNGTCLYTTNFTVPSAPLTAISNTNFLLNMTNAGIIDNAMMNVLETVGNAQISTSVSKFGGGSMAFDGTGDYLVTPSSPSNILGSGDFTVEFWMYPSNTSSAYRALVASENYNATTGGWTIYQNGTSIEIWLSPGTPSSLITATSAITASTWQHVALSRASGTVRLFVNGTSVGSASNSAEWTGQRIFIGDNNVTGTDYFYNGYIDELRITKGVARYTANFTPQTSQWQDQ